MRQALLPKHVIAVIRSQKDPLKALEMFNSAKSEQGFNHNSLTYKSMVEKLGSHGEFKAMEDLLSQMRTELDNSLLENVYLGAIRSYGKNRKVQEAMDLFERLDFYGCEPSILTYNSVMNLMVENGLLDQAHKLYLKMINNGISPDVYSHTIRIKSFCKSNRPLAALKLLKNVCEDSNAVTYCTVVAGLYENGLRSDARRVFDEMLDRGIFPDVLTSNKLIHLLARRGDIRECERILGKVMKRGVSPNIFTYNIFIQGLCKNGSVDLAAKLLEGAKRGSLNPDVVTYNTLIHGLCKKSSVEEAEVYLRKMVNKGLEPDGFTYNTVLHGFCKSGKILKAEALLKDAAKQGFVPDEFTVCSLIDGFSSGGDIDRARSTFEEALSKGLKPSIVLYNTMVKVLSRHELIEQALDLINEINEKTECKPSIWTYNLVIDKLCKRGFLSDAYRVVDTAISRDCHPDIYTFNTLVDIHCKQLSLNKAIEVVNRMRDQKIAPDVITYNTLLNGLCKTGRYEDVMKTFREMEAKGCDPNIKTYNILVESLCVAQKVDEALKLLNEIKDRGLAPDIVCFGALITGFCKVKDLNGAFKLFRRAVREFKLSHTTSTYNIMIKGFVEKLHVGSAEFLFHEMSKVGIKPDAYTYRVMIDGFCNTGNTDSGFAFLIEMMKKEFVPSLTTIGMVLNCLCTSFKVREAVEIVNLMVNNGLVPKVVDEIFDATKRKIAAPKIVAKEMLKNDTIAYNTYELLVAGIRDKKLDHKMLLEGSSWIKYRGRLMKSRFRK